MVEAPSRDIVIVFLGKHKPTLFHGGTQSSFSASESTTQPDGRSRKKPGQLDVETMSDSSASQRRMALSDEPDTIRDPSGENATELTPLECPSSGLPMGSPVSASQRRMVLSHEPDTIQDPSRENATDSTRLECPSSGLPMGSPVSASQRRMVLSHEPDTIRDPSRENATEMTPLECPWKIFWIAGQFAIFPLCTDTVFMYFR